MKTIVICLSVLLLMSLAEAMPGYGSTGAPAVAKTRSPALAASPVQAKHPRITERITVELKYANVPNAINAVFAALKQQPAPSYVIDKGLFSYPYVGLSMKLQDVPFSDAVDEICRSAKVVLTIGDDNVYNFGPAKVADSSMDRINKYRQTCWTFEPGGQLEPELHKMWESQGWDSPHRQAMASGKYDTSPVPAARFYYFPASDIDKWMRFEAHRPRGGKTGGTKQHRGPKGPLPKAGAAAPPAGSLSSLLQLSTGNYIGTCLGAVKRDGRWMVTVKTYRSSADFLISSLFNLVGVDFTSSHESLNARNVSIRLCGVPLEEAVRAIATAGGISCTRQGSIYVIAPRSGQPRPAPPVPKSK